MPTMPVVSWEMTARDVKRQAAFYSELFGWQFNFDKTEDFASVVTGGIDGAITRVDPPASDIYFYVQVPNVQEILDKVPALGGSVPHPAQENPGGGCTAFITDTEGNVMGLYQAGKAGG